MKKISIAIFFVARNSSNKTDVNDNIIINYYKYERLKSCLFIIFIMISYPTYLEGHITIIR